MSTPEQLLSEKLERFVERVEQRFPGGRACTLRLCRRQELALIAAHGFSAEGREGNIALVGTAAGDALTSGKPDLITIAEDPRYANKALAASQGWVTLLAVPLIRSGQQFGVIQIYSSERIDALSQSAVQAIEEDARLAAIDLELIAQLQAKDQLLSLLEYIIGATDLPAAYGKLVETAADLLDRQACAVYRVHGRQLELAAGFPVDGARHGVGKRCLVSDLPAAAEAIRSREPVIVRDALTDPRTVFAVPHLRRWQVASICYFPIVHANGSTPSAAPDATSGGQVVALLAIDHGRDRPDFSDEELATIRLFGHAAGALAQRERLVELERRLAQVPSIPLQAKTITFEVVD